jgi:hypothetical protein
VVDDRLCAVPNERLGELDDQGVSKVLVRGQGPEPGVRVMVTHLPDAVDGLRVQEVGEVPRPCLRRPGRGQALRPGLRPPRGGSPTC